MLNSFPEVIKHFTSRKHIALLKRSGVTKIIYKGFLLCSITESNFITNIMFNDIFKNQLECQNFQIQNIPHGNLNDNLIERLKNTISITIKILDILHETYPRIFVNTEFTRPSQITMACFAGIENLKYILLDYDTKISKFNSILPKIKDIITFHYKDRNGQILFFGNITGYTYYEKKDVGYEFDVLGSFINPHADPDPQVSGFVSID